MKKIIIILNILNFNLFLFSGELPVQAALVTLNWPTSFGQPGYQMEVIPPSPSLAWPSWIKKTNGPTPIVADWTSDKAGGFFGLNSLQTQGYCSQALFQNTENAFYLRRPDLSKISSNISSLYSWSDLLTAARASLRVMNYGYFQNNEGPVYNFGILAWSNPTTNPAIVSETIPYDLTDYSPSLFPSYIWNFSSTSKQITYKGEENFTNDSVVRAKGTPTAYVFPGYGSYYANPSSTNSLCFFNNKTFNQYIYQYQNLLTNIANDVFNNITDYVTSTGTPRLYYSWVPEFSSNYTAITVGSFLQTLPGFVSGETSGALFSGVFIGNNVSFITDNNPLVSNLITYNPVPGDNQTVYLGNGLIIYLPIFTTDPGKPYIPSGWNFATSDQVFVPEKTLMTNYSEQLSFTTALIVPGS